MLAPERKDNEALLNEVQAAQFLNLSIRTLQAWRLRSAGPRIVRAGRAIRYRRRDLIAWIDAHTENWRASSESRPVADQGGRREAPVPVAADLTQIALCGETVATATGELVLPSNIALQSVLIMPERKVGLDD